MEPLVDFDSRPPVAGTGSDRSDLQKIDDFKRGYQEPIDRHVALVRNAQQMLASASLSGEDRKSLHDARAALDKLLLHIQTLSRSLSSDLQPLNLDRDVMRDYHTVFAGEANDHRLSYVRFLRTYVLLKRFALDASDAWTSIQKIIARLDLQSGAEFRDQFVSFGVTAGLRSCEGFQIFCQRMAILLQLQKDPIVTKKLDGAAIYSPEIDYLLSGVFREDLAAWMEARRDSLATDRAQLSDSALPTATRKQWIGPESAGAPRSMDWRLDASGKQSWNSTPQYYLQYSPQDLEAERAAFQEVVYIDTHMGADQQFIRSDFILTVSRKDRNAVASDIEREYVNFMRAFFTLVTDISMLNVNVPPSDRYLFLYHLGPQAFCALVVKFLQDVKTGFMHQRPANRKVIRKFTPIELIKKTIIDWWRTEIIPGAAAKSEDYTDYKRLLTQVKSAHAAMVKRAQAEFERLPAEVRARGNKQQIFKDHMNEWFGAPNIVIFKRFLKA
ncbi:MAG: hypothetical protein K1X75_11320 [Leptospirales bacterium]|nr:hypothetical protein [Leptospirales bacterium]